MLAATLAPGGLAPMTPTTPAPAPTQAMAFTCTADACAGTGATDFTFKTLQNLINMANVQIARKAGVFASLFSKTPVIPVDGRITKATLAAYLPVSRTIGGVLAIFDFTPDIKFLATNAQKFALEIARWLGMTWVERPGVPGHWERMRVGQTTPTLPSIPAGPSPLPALCPPPAVATSQGCLWPPGTIATFSKKRGKWRIAVPAGTPGTPGGPPSGAPGGFVRGGFRPTTPTTPTTPQPSTPQPSTPSTPRGGVAPRPSSFGFGWYGFGAASHVVVAETDAPPPGVQQVTEDDFAAASGEAPSTPAPQAPPTPSTPAPQAPSTPAPQGPPARVDVGPTSAPPRGGPPEAPPGRPEDFGPPGRPEAFGPPGRPATFGPPGVPAQVPATVRAHYTDSKCIARFNKSRKVFSIFCPVGSAAATAAVPAPAPSPSQFGIYDDSAFRCLYGNCGFGEDAADVPPAGFVKVGEESALPLGVKEVDKPFFKQPLFWIAVVGGVVVVGGGSYMLIRRRRKPAA